MKTLRDRNAILTGASRGLGVHLARALAQEGVNMSSLAGKIGLPLSAPYGATKAGLVMFTHSLRAELAGTHSAPAAERPPGAHPRKHALHSQHTRHDLVCAEHRRRRPR